MKLLGPSGWHHPDLLRIAGPTVDGAFFSSGFDPSHPSPLVQDFVARYRAAYGREPTPFAAQGFDAANLVGLQLAERRALARRRAQRPASTTERIRAYRASRRSAPTATRASAPSCSKCATARWSRSSSHGRSARRPARSPRPRRHRPRHLPRSQRSRHGPGRIFGGQVAAQSLVAAARTVDGLHAHSLHGYFLRPGDPRVPVVFTVDRIRDGALVHHAPRRRAPARSRDLQHVGLVPAARAGLRAPDADARRARSRSRCRRAPSW